MESKYELFVGVLLPIKLEVVDFDLDKMFPEAADWIKKMMN